MPTYSFDSIAPPALVSWWHRLKKAFTFLPNRRRWSDHDKHWGIFTYSHDKSSTYRPLSIHLRSADKGAIRSTDQWEYDGCHLRVSGFGHTWIMELPEIIKPVQTKIYPKTWDQATIERLGRDYYIDYHHKEYGVALIKGAMHVHYGAQTDVSTTDKTKVFFYPWRELRFKRESFYDEHHRVAVEVLADTVHWAAHELFEKRQQAKARAPRFYFLAIEQDGVPVKVTTYLSETQFAYGKGYFKWVGWFRAAVIHRWLHIEFEHEVGSEKGSYKGGLMGGSIQTHAAESPECALQRYIEEAKVRQTRDRLRLTYLGRIQEDGSEYSPA